LRRLRFTDNISGLQIFQLLRFTSFLVISMLFAKSHLTREQVGTWELFLFIASFLSFFWVTGVIQSLLPLYHRNKTYRKLGDNSTARSPEIFNAFILLAIMAVLMFIACFLLSSVIAIPGLSDQPRLVFLLLIYILLSSPVCLIEYIYLLNNRPHRIFQYGIYTFALQLVLVLVPLYLQKDLVWSVYGLLVVTGVRWIWLIGLLRKYAEFTISSKFIKEHLYLGTPLILTSLISGSGQYIDGVIVTAAYSDPATFAVFRFGAKEFPLVVMMAQGLSNALLPEFSTRQQMAVSLQRIKDKSRKLMHTLFPAALFMMLIARWLFPIMFTIDYKRSADIFLIYLLLAIPRLVFPQTIIIGRKRTRITMIAAIAEQVVNIPLSLFLLKYYGIVGVALATFIVYTVGQGSLIAYLYFKMKIKPSQYIPMVPLLIYSSLLIILFVLIDHRIIDLN
jgi:O-antigen/teichoic acid export membrane protein